MIRISRRAVRIGLLLAAAGALPLAAWGIARWTSAQTRAGLEAVAQERLGVYAAELAGELERYRALPLALSWDPEIAALLTRPRDADLAERIARRFAALDAGPALSALEVVAPDGTALATATRKPAEGPAWVFAFPVWAPVWAESPTLGMVTARIALDGLETGWREAAAGTGERVIVTDRRDLILITTVPEWRRDTLARLPVDMSHHLVRSASVLDTEWHVHVLFDTAALDARPMRAALASGVAMLLLPLAVVVIRRRGRTAPRQSLYLLPAPRELPDRDASGPV